MVTSLRLKQLVVGAVATHSLVLGSVMLAAPVWMLNMSGWRYEGPSFFPAQSGLFLLILGGAYTAAIWLEPFAWFLVASKAAAFVFLVAEWACGNGPSTLPLVAGFDGLMGLTVTAVVILSRSAEKTRPP